MPEPRITPVFKTLLVDTVEQTYLLTELNMAHTRLFRLLEKIRDNAVTSLGWANLDTLFLTGSTNQLTECVTAYKTLRLAAGLGGCSREDIAAVCTTDRIIIERQGETQ